MLDGVCHHCNSSRGRRGRTAPSAIRRLGWVRLRVWPTQGAGCSSPVSYTPRSGPHPDARISYPLNSEVDTIPAWAAVFAPIMMLLATVLVGEFLTSRRQHASITQAVATAIYFFLDGVQVGQHVWNEPVLVQAQGLAVLHSGRCARAHSLTRVPLPPSTVQAFVMSLLLTQVFKVMVGRLRPNFLARCVALQAAAQFLLLVICCSLGNKGRGICFADEYTCAFHHVRKALSTSRQLECTPRRCQPAVPNGATIPLQNVTQAMLWQNQVGFNAQRIHLHLPSHVLRGQTLCCFNFNFAVPLH